MDDAGGSDGHMFEDDLEGLDMDDQIQVIQLDESANPSEPIDDEDIDVDEDQQSTSNFSGAEPPPDNAACAVIAHEKDCFVVALFGHRWMASGGEDDVAHIWDLDVSANDPVLSVQHKDSVTCASFNHNGTLFASADLSGTIVITQLSDLTIKCELDDCSDLEWMFWHKSSDIVFAGDKDGTLWMWLIGTTGIAQSKVYASGGDSACSAACLLSDGKRLMAGYADGTVRLWNLKDQTHASIRTDSAIVSVAQHPTLELAAVGSERGTVYLLTTGGEQFKKVHYFAVTTPVPRAPKTDDDDNEQMEEENVENCVECLSFSPNHPWLAAGRNDGSLAVYEADAHGLRFLHRNASGQAIVSSLWTREGSAPVLVTSSVDGTIRIFDPRNGSLHKELQAGGDEVLDLKVVQTDPLRLIAACSGGAIRVFDA